MERPAIPYPRVPQIHAQSAPDRARLTTPKGKGLQRQVGRNVFPQRESVAKTACTGQAFSHEVLKSRESVPQNPIGPAHQRLAGPIQPVTSPQSVAGVLPEAAVTFDDILKMDSLNPLVWPLKEITLEPGREVPAHATGFYKKSSLLHRAIDNQGSETSDPALIVANVAVKTRQRTIERRLHIAEEAAHEQDRRGRRSNCQRWAETGLMQSQRVNADGPPRSKSIPTIVEQASTATAM